MDREREGEEEEIGRERRNPPTHPPSHPSTQRERRRERREGEDTNTQTHTHRERGRDSQAHTHACAVDCHNREGLLYPNREVHGGGRGALLHRGSSDRSQNLELRVDLGHGLVVVIVPLAVGAVDVDVDGGHEPPASLQQDLVRVVRVNCVRQREGMCVSVYLFVCAPRLLMFVRECVCVGWCLGTVLLLLSYPWP